MLLTAPHVTGLSTTTLVLHAGQELGSYIHGRAGQGSAWFLVRARFGYLSVGVACLGTAGVISSADKFDIEPDAGPLYGDHPPGITPRRSPFRQKVRARVFLSWAGWFHQNNLVLSVPTVVSATFRTRK